MRYYAHINGANQGPFNLGELQKLVSEGSIVATTFVAAEGSQTWIKASEVAGLFNSPPPVHSTPHPPVSGSSVNLGSANQHHQSQPAANSSGNSIGNVVADINLKTGMLFLFSFLSSSVFLLLHIDRLSAALTKITNSDSKCLRRGYAVFLACAAGLSTQIQITALTADSKGVSLLGSLCSLVAGAAMIYWAFEIRKVIQAYYTEKYSSNYQMNGFYTFLFNVFYINYCINELLEVEASGKV